jgi:hypothetical protein
MAKSVAMKRSSDAAGADISERARNGPQIATG